MAERANAYVRLESDPGNILFKLPSLTRELREGDVFTYTAVGGTPVTYKIESVDLRVVLISRGTQTNPRDIWKSPEVYYGVSVVP